MAVLFFNLGARRELVANFTPRPLYTRESDPVSIVQEAGWVSGPGWIGAENFVHTGISSPGTAARNESLYTLVAPLYTYLT